MGLLPDLHWQRQQDRRCSRDGFKGLPSRRHPTRVAFEVVKLSVAWLLLVPEVTEASMCFMATAQADLLRLRPFATSGPWHSQVGPRGPRYHNFSQSAVTGLEDVLQRGFLAIGPETFGASESGFECCRSVARKPRKRSSHSKALKSGGAHEGRAHLGLYSISASASFELGSSRTVLGPGLKRTLQTAPTQRPASTCKLSDSLFVAFFFHILRADCRHLKLNCPKLPLCCDRFNAADLKSLSLPTA